MLTPKIRKNSKIFLFLCAKQRVKQTKIYTVIQIHFKGTINKDNNNNFAG